jgi:hypothetical protein
MITLHRTVVAFLTYFLNKNILFTLNSGSGFPLHRLLKAQVPCLTVLLLVEFSIVLIRGSSPPDLLNQLY